MLDLMNLSAEFPKDAISWRAQSVTGDGKSALALAYIDARDVRGRFNSVCGVSGWQSEHYDCGGGKLACKIGVRIDGEWIWKTDGAGDTDVEAQKGAFSDALKRAAVSWGVGEYLYGDRFKGIWVECESYKKGEKWMWKKFTADPWDKVKPEAVTVDKENIKKLLNEAKDEKELIDIWKRYQTELKILIARDSAGYADLVWTKDTRKTLLGAKNVVS